VLLIDPPALQTLPPREGVAGLAEVIQYGMIADSKFFEYLERHVEGLRGQAEEVIPEVIRRCCEIKAEVVGGDERESGHRRILNYGHTVGHALETWGHYKTWIHGEAVGIGMVQEAAIAQYLGMCNKELVERQRDLVQDVGLPIAMPAMNFKEFWDAMKHDKKVVNGQVNCVVPKKIGEVQVVPLVRQHIRQWFATSQASRRNLRKPVLRTSTRPRLLKKK
jgi:3-dehydroquinate synthase